MTLQLYVSNTSKRTFTVDEQLFFEACTSNKLRQEWENSMQAIVQIPSIFAIGEEAVVHWLVMLYNPTAKPADLIKIIETDPFRLISRGEMLNHIWVLENHFGDWRGQNRNYRRTFLSGRSAF